MTLKLSRVTITIPRSVLVAADRRAKELDRSRSWVLVEALRGYLDTPAPRSLAVRESEPPTYAAEAVAEARRHHLAHDLELSPAERLRRGEALARLARQIRPRARRDQVIGFNSYEDFYEWKKANRAGA